MPSWIESAGKKIGGFFENPGKVMERELRVGPPGGKTPQIKPEEVVKPKEIENPYAPGAAAGMAIQQQMLPAYQQAATEGLAATRGFIPEYSRLFGTGAGAVSGLIGDLQAQARGQAGPGASLGQALLQQGLTQNIGAVRSQLASQRGLSPAMRARMAAGQTAALQGQTAQQAGMLGLQQQLAAQQQLGQLGMGAATLGSEARMRAAGELAGAAAPLQTAIGQMAQSDITMRDIAARTGLGEEQIKARLAEANQAASAGDKQRATSIVTSLVGGGAQVGAGYAMKKAYGGRIDGVAPYAGDTPKNDVVPANLSPGEIVIPRSAAGSKKEAKKFIDALDDWDEEPSYGKVLKARQKKNYADGGMVTSDEQKTKEAAQAYLDQQRAPYPMVEKAKAAFDEFLTNRVVEPLAQRGYPTLGAALATVPSTAMEALVPSTPDDLMASMIPGPKSKRGLKKKLADEVIKEDYRLMHKAPKQTGAPLHDLTTNQVYPSDVYAKPDYYLASEDEKKAADIILQNKGKPNAEITIYRAVPKGVSEINPGDWVALTKEYAEKHLEKDGKVISSKVRAKDLFTDGNSFAEFGYNGKKPVKIKE